jgi:hypothetical protein
MQLNEPTMELAETVAAVGELFEETVTGPPTVLELTITMPEFDVTLSVPPAESPAIVTGPEPPETVTGPTIVLA